MVDGLHLINDQGVREKVLSSTGYCSGATHVRLSHLNVDGVVEAEYTTRIDGNFEGEAVAFIRRKGNSFYLVHNVRRGGKVRQIHLARLGDRARITDEVVREVSRKHPFVELNWQALRNINA